MSFVIESSALAANCLLYFIVFTRRQYHNGTDSRPCAPLPSIIEMRDDSNLYLDTGRVRSISKALSAILHTHTHTHKSYCLHRELLWSREFVGSFVGSFVRCSLCDLSKSRFSLHLAQMFKLFITSPVPVLFWEVKVTVQGHIRRTKYSLRYLGRQRIWDCKK